jgi:hypothetical protein
VAEVVEADVGGDAGLLEVALEGAHRGVTSAVAPEDFDNAGADPNTLTTRLRHLRLDALAGVPVCPRLPLQALPWRSRFGKDTLLKQTFYGFRVHVRGCLPGVITRISVAPANVHELRVLPELAEGTSGLIVGDRNYHSPKTREELAGMGVELLAPYSSKKRDPTPNNSALLSRLRYRIDTVFSQLTGRYCVKRVWARDTWHLASRLAAFGSREGRRRTFSVRRRDGHQRFALSAVWLVA